MFLNNAVSLAQSSKLQENFVKYYNSGLRYSLLPLAKEIIARDPVTVQGLEKTFEEVILLLGSRNLQGFSVEQLSKHKFDVIDYILGRKLFLKGDYLQSENYFKRVSSNSKFHPMALQALATISSLQKQEEKAQINFEKCEKEAAKLALANSNSIAQQYRFVQYQCQMGRARVIYGLHKYSAAEKAYEQIQKKSYLWPIILVEEAWNSYQTKSYNRSLGKVATYKAPQLRYAYKPEVDVVRAISYLEMCLYADALDTVNSFYKVYEPLAKYLEGTLDRYNRDTEYYYNLAVTGVNQEGPYNDFLQGTLKDPDVHILTENLKNSKSELQIIQNKIKGRLQDVLESSYVDYQESQRALIGRIIRTKFKKFSVDIREALQDMSYIKLEILGRQKTALYRGKELKGKRGDVEYLKKTRAQYFWNFKGEFWADELGDYVFALASECNVKSSEGNKQ